MVECPINPISAPLQLNQKGSEATFFNGCFVDAAREEPSWVIDRCGFLWGDDAHGFSSTFKFSSNIQKVSTHSIAL
jgi:hypothetical protein